ncbi:MAG: hypothetical protein M4579_002043 [Chaenotheca gracillima]|nr:MAG: hypothetical protein M4579_002043 [Chaenotheca gracillima]
MSAPNGVLSPPSLSTATTSLATPGKRKREDSVASGGGSGFSELAKSSSEAYDQTRLATFLVDLLEVLKRHDTTPSILERTLSTSEPASEPDAKRTKLSAQSPDSSITSKVSSRSYTTLEAVGEDVERASTAVLAKHEHDHHGVNGISHPRLSHTPLDDKALLAEVLAFKKVFNNAVIREREWKRTRRESNGDKLSDASPNKKSPGTNETTKVEPRSEEEEDTNSRAILTLFGNAPNPRQLFSSLQEPTRISSKGSQTQSLSSSINSSSQVAITAPLRDIPLPNGITVAKVLPTEHKHENGSRGRSIPTLGKLFAPPSTLAPLSPPKQSKQTNTRGNSIDFYQPSEVETNAKIHRRDGYASQPLNTGQWLSYNLLPISQPSSPNAKRKQRERALSTGESRPTLLPEEIAAREKAKEEALFRRAYSSFAPSRDDTAAIVSEGVKSRVWWDRYAVERSERSNAASDGAGKDNFGSNVTESNGNGEFDDASFEEVIRAWVPEEPPADLESKDPKIEADVKDVEKVLEDISDLLETLNSYNRLRHLPLTSANGPEVPQLPQVPTMQSMTGSPSKPSAAETDVYNLLKSQLSLMVATLPPYAVAKLDGNQLSALNISTRLELDGENFRGVMDEDEATAKAKAAASLMASASGVRTATPSGPYQPPSSAYPPRSAYAHQPLGQRPPSSQYQPSPQPAQVRPVAATPSRMGGPPPQAYQHSRPPSNAPHGSNVGYAPMTPYAQGPPRPPTQPHYSQANAQQLFQQPPNQYPYGQQYPRPAQQGVPPPGSMQSHQQYAQQPSQPQYQRHAQQRQSSQGYARSPYPAPNGRASSPQKPPPSYSPQPQPPTQPQFQQRSNSGNPYNAPPTPQHDPNRQYYPQTPQLPQHQGSHPQPPHHPQYPPQQTSQQPLQQSPQQVQQQVHHQQPSVQPEQPQPQSHPQPQTQPSPQPQPQQQPQPPPRPSSNPSAATQAAQNSTPVGASGFHTYLTAAEQASMMERQRAQLAAQQGINHRAAQANMGTSPSQAQPLMSASPQPQPVARPPSAGSHNQANGIMSPEKEGAEPSKPIGGGEIGVAAGENVNGP